MLSLNSVYQKYYSPRNSRGIFKKVTLEHIKLEGSVSILYNTSSMHLTGRKVVKVIVIN
jgi:hypothetical protein